MSPEKIRAVLHVFNYTTGNRVIGAYTADRNVYIRSDGSHYIIVKTNSRPYRETVVPHPDHPGEFLLERRSTRLIQEQRLPEILAYLRDKPAGPGQRAVVLPDASESED